jgi:transcription termination/antitermination protein NusG
VLENKISQDAAPVNERARWYIVQAYSGFEKRVAQSIKDDAEKNGLSDCFLEIVIPAEETLEMKRGKKVKTERKFFPGYVLVRMVMTEATWQLVKSIPKVNGFLGGSGNRPKPITQAEADRIFDQLNVSGETVKDRNIFEVGDNVKVVDGPFESFVGIIEEVDNDKERLKLSVSIFGRPTPVDLQFSQVQKV